MAAVRIAATAALIDGRVVGPTCVIVADGVIVGIEEPRADDVVVDGLLAPAFIDLQVNGVDDIDFWDADAGAMSRAADLLARHGVCGFLPTLVTNSLDRYSVALERLSGAMATDQRILGIHLEGPFLGGSLGAHRAEWVHDIDLDWLRALPSTVRLMTLAPEQPHAVEAIRLLVERGVVVSLGHTNAAGDTVKAAIDAGATLATHVFNGSGRMHHRSPDFIGTVLADDRLACSFIADLVHVDSAWLQIAGRAKPEGRRVLVSDSVAWRRASAGGLRLSVVDGAPRLADGTLAGSALWLDDAVRTVVRHASWSVAQAASAASATPAGLIGLTDRGHIAVGYHADLVALGADGSRLSTWMGGVRR
jgi:N-acetylglucosamine-6-phosphate deacetylase